MVRTKAYASLCHEKQTYFRIDYANMTDPARGRLILETRFTVTYACLRFNNVGGSPREARFIDKLS